MRSPEPLEAHTGDSSSSTEHEPIGRLPSQEPEVADEHVAQHELHELPPSSGALPTALTNGAAHRGELVGEADEA